MILMKAIPSGKYLSHRIFFAKAMAMTIDLVYFQESLFQKKIRAMMTATPIIVAMIKNPVLMVSDGDGDGDID